MSLFSGIIQQVSPTNSFWNGLTGYYNTNETSGVVLTDTKSGLSGSVSNAAIWNTGGKNNGCMNNNATYYGTIPYANANQLHGASMTFSCWYYITSYATQTSFVQQAGASGNRAFQINIYNTGDGKMQLVLGNSTGVWATGGVVATTNSMLVLNAWTHLVVTVTAGVGASIYSNGVKIEDFSIPTVSLKAVTTDLLIGYYTSASFAGKMDEIAFWNRGLTATEVSALYINGAVNQSIWYGLESYWKLNEQSGTVVSDAIGGKTGTASDGTKWIAGKNNNGYELSGSSYINFGNIVTWTRTQPWSVSAWCKKYSNTASFVPILSNLNASTSASIDCYFNQTSGNMSQALMYNNSGGRVLAGYNARFPANTDWHHVVFTYNGDWTAGNMRCYIDGTAYTPDAVTNTMTYTGSLGTDIQIGRRYTTTYPDDAKIDEVGLWNRVLTATEVNNIYNAGNGLFY